MSSTQSAATLAKVRSTPEIQLNWWKKMRQSLAMNPNRR
jgi:hypothetical protein